MHECYCAEWGTYDNHVPEDFLRLAHILARQGQLLLGRQKLRFKDEAVGHTQTAQGLGEH